MYVCGGMIICNSLESTVSAVGIKFCPVLQTGLDLHLS